MTRRNCNNVCMGERRREEKLGPEEENGKRWTEAWESERHPSEREREGGAGLEWARAWVGEARRGVASEQSRTTTAPRNSPGAVSFALSRSTSLALGTSIDDLLFHFRASSTLARGVPHPPGPRPPVSDWNALEPDRINLPPFELSASTSLDAWRAYLRS
ncbi:hypothetical protein CEP52_000511 [Fusarium oligoseptatum]|uniref:Uncharacterized protein n=1 Tax=Fusarium oligoseptatum TaxID=2604345 RepID=A0A428UNY8_9HYPO|nr:hypothetical protein CEP52_000511 [Fusarium oligoseptatum]